MHAVLCFIVFVHEDTNKVKGNSLLTPATVSIILSINGRKHFPIWKFELDFSKYKFI